MNLLAKPVKKLPFISDALLEILSEQGICEDDVMSVGQMIHGLPETVSADDLVKSLNTLNNPNAYKVLMLLTRQHVGSSVVLKVFSVHKQTYYRRGLHFSSDIALLALAIAKYQGTA